MSRSLLSPSYYVTLTSLRGIVGSFSKARSSYRMPLRRFILALESATLRRAVLTAGRDVDDHKLVG